MLEIIKVHVDNKGILEYNEESKKYVEEDESEKPCHRRHSCWHDVAYKLQMTKFFSFG
jgi:hypothetical protein